MRMRQPRVQIEPIRPNHLWCCSENHPLTSWGTRVTLELPELSDSSVRVCHGLMRDILNTFEEHYRHQLSRAYGWAPAGDGAEENEEDDEDDDWVDIV